MTMNVFFRLKNLLKSVCLLTGENVNFEKKTELNFWIWKNKIYQNVLNRSLNKKQQ